MGRAVGRLVALVGFSPWPVFFALPGGGFHFDSFRLVLIRFVWEVLWTAWRELQ